MFEEIRNIIVNSLGCEESIVTMDASVEDDLGADSLAVVELVMALEYEFGITIGDDKVKDIATVGDIVALIESIRAAAV